MRVVFMGTPEFAVRSLNQLYDDGFDIVGVFTQPDKPCGRGLKVSGSPVKKLALSQSTPVFQPISLREKDVADSLRALQCDIIAVTAYGKLLSREILDIPPLGCVNIHGSILPKYRGAAPIQHSILAGDRETGITSMYMAEELDAGDMIFTKVIPIGDDETSGELFGRLSTLGAEVLSETLQAISYGLAPRIPQNHADATYAPQLTRDMAPIDWNDTAFNIKCKVRAFNPWPIATAEFGNKTFKIFSVDICDDRAGKKPGEIIDICKSTLRIACADGSIIVNELQAPGCKRMTAAECLRGNARCFHDRL